MSEKLKLQPFLCRAVFLALTIPLFQMLAGWALGVGLRRSSLPRAFLLKGKSGQK